MTSKVTNILSDKRLQPSVLATLTHLTIIL